MSLPQGDQTREVEPTAAGYNAFVFSTSLVYKGLNPPEFAGLLVPQLCVIRVGNSFMNGEVVQEGLSKYRFNGPIGLGHCGEMRLCFPNLHDAAERHGVEHPGGNRRRRGQSCVQHVAIPAFGKGCMADEGPGQALADDENAH